MHTWHVLPKPWIDISYGVVFSGLLLFDWGVYCYTDDRRYWKPLQFGYVLSCWIHRTLDMSWRAVLRLSGSRQSIW